MKKHIGIQEPCSEDWNKMTPTASGAFCQVCQINVVDFTGKSNEEINQVLREANDERVCGRISLKQEMSLEHEFNAWQLKSKRSVQQAMLFSLLVVFGLTLFSCSNKNDMEMIHSLQSKARNFTELVNSEKVFGHSEEDVTLIERLVEIENVPDIIETKCSVMGQMAVIDEEVINEYEYVTAGVMIRSNDYIEYLEEIVPHHNERVIEYDENGIEIPEEYQALVFPNPATEVTTLKIGLPTIEDFNIDVFDMKGTFIEKIHHGKLNRGTHTKELNLVEYQPGTYLIIVRSKNYNETIRFVKL